jgi:hypothetical protein
MSKISKTDEHTCAFPQCQNLLNNNKFTSYVNFLSFLVLQGSCDLVGKQIFLLQSFFFFFSFVRRALYHLSYLVIPFCDWVLLR